MNRPSDGLLFINEINEDVFLLKLLLHFLR